MGVYTVSVVLCSLSLVSITVMLVVCLWVTKETNTPTSKLFILASVFQFTFNSIQIVLIVNAGKL